MRPDFFTMDDFDLGGKTVIVRVDLNSPINPNTGEFLDDTRVKLHLPTLKELRHSKVVLMAHQSRPGKGDYTTLKEHANVVSMLLGSNVTYVDDLLGSRAKEAVKELEEGEIVLLENVRFYAEEVTLKNCEFGKQATSHIVRGLGPLAQYFIHDAFAAAHRCQPSLTGFTAVMPSCAGRLMENEIVNLGKALDPKNKPRVVILGGAKFDDSIAMVDNMLRNDLADIVLTGGAVANFYLHTKGVKIGGPSLDFLMKECDAKFNKIVEKARRQLERFGNRIHLPMDVAVNDNGNRKNLKLTELPSDHHIYDIGLDTIHDYSVVLSKAASIVVNGPMGVFEVEEFALGTEGVFAAVSETDAYKVAGGGHTAATLENLGLSNKMDHISSGGGASLTFLAGGDMPGIRALELNKARFAGCKLP